MSKSMDVIAGTGLERKSWISHMRRLEVDHRIRIIIK